MRLQYTQSRKVLHDVSAAHQSLPDQQSVGTIARQGDSHAAAVGGRQRSRIARLAATLGIERRPVENDAAIGLDRQHLGLRLAQLLALGLLGSAAGIALGTGLAALALKLLGGDLGGAVKGFKDGMKDGGQAPADDAAAATTTAQVTAPAAPAAADKNTIDVQARQKT